MSKEQTEKEPSDILCEKILEKIYPELVEKLEHDIEWGKLRSVIDRRIEHCNIVNKVR